MQVTIEKLVYGGDGLARLPAPASVSAEKGRGKTVLLPFVLAGEHVQAGIINEKSAFARGRAENILESSPHRIEPACPYFRRCGGCHYQHADYEHQLEIKAAILKETLARIAKFHLGEELRVHPCPQPWNYRNRTRLRLRTAPKFALGYFRFGSHSLLPVEQCPISSPLINRAIEVLWKLGRAVQVREGIGEIEFFADAEDERLLVEIHAAQSAKNDYDENAAVLAKELRRVLPQVAAVAIFAFTNAPANPKAAPRILLSSPSGSGLLYRTRDFQYQVSAGAFFQTNRFLVDEIIELVTGNRQGALALDLYAGGGLFSLPLAKNFERVIAVEAAPFSFADLRRNAVSNVRPVHATTEEYLEKAKQKLHPELIIVDPPRSGLGKNVTRALSQLSVPHLIYVSCDPATLSRDLHGLLESGYRVERAHLIDLFPQTFHIESVFHLMR